MNKSDEERRELIRNFYQIYRPIQRENGLRYHMHFDLHGNNIIEIWQYKGDTRGRCICKIKEESEVACYQRAIEALESYSGKETVRHERKAGQQARFSA